MYSPVCYQTTYKELKLGTEAVSKYYTAGYQTTYKELKHKKI